MEKLKAIKVKQPDGLYSNEIPIGADAVNIDMANGTNLEQTLGNVNVLTDGNIINQIKNVNNIKLDKNVYNSDMAAMNAKVDNILTIPEGYIPEAGTAAAALWDIRLKYDGTSASSPGNAVREQIDEVMNHISLLEKFTLSVKGDGSLLLTIQD